jgi:hypothetical protein
MRQQALHDGSPMMRPWIVLLRWSGVDPRGFAALLRAFVLMDLRGQHYAAATATKPHYLLSPLFLVVGQCLTASALCCGFLFARVDVFFFAFANLALSMLVLGTAIVVEFQEAALDPDDLAVIAPRPVAPRTYAASRLANLLFYFMLIFAALNLFPAIVGAGLLDAGPWFAPAYLAAALAGNLAVLALLVLLLSAARRSESLLAARQVLSWTQIVAILVVFYGGQLMLRDGTAALQVWAADPPSWTVWLPPAWLARFVEDAAVQGPEIAPFALCAIVTIASCTAVTLRLERLYRTMQPVEQSSRARAPMPAHRLGGLAIPGLGWLVRSPEERAGCWLALTFLRRDAGLMMRALFSFQLSVVTAVLGIALGQFDNPCRETDPARTALSLLAFFLMPLAAPPLVFHLAYCRDSAGGWILQAAPLAQPGRLARGACLAMQAIAVTPLCLALGIAAAVVWGDPAAGLMHAGLAWGLTWIFLLASLVLLRPALPFSQPPPRGAALALPPLPMLAMSAAVAFLAAVHLVAARFALYWLAIFAVLPLAGWMLNGLAVRRGNLLGRAS